MLYNHIDTVIGYWKSHYFIIHFFSIISLNILNATESESEYQLYQMTNRVIVEEF